MTDAQRKYCDMLRDAYYLKLQIETLTEELQVKREQAGQFAFEKLGGNEHRQANEWARKQGWVRTP